MSSIVGLAPTPGEEDSTRRNLDDLLAGRLKPLSLEERVRSAYGRSIDDRLLSVFDAKAAELGAAGMRMPGGDIVVGASVKADPETGSPAGIMLKVKGLQGEETQVPWELDDETRAKVKAVANERDEVFADIVESGKEITNPVTRFAAESPRGMDDKLKFLEGEFGEGNVYPIGDNNAIIIKDGEPHLIDRPINESEFGLGMLKGLPGDIADAGPGLIEGGIGIAGSLAGQRFGGTAGERVAGAAADFVAPFVRAGAGKLAGAGDVGSAGELAEAGVTNAALGSVLGLGADTANQLNRLTGPTATLGRWQGKKTIFTAAGEKTHRELAEDAHRLSQETGVDLTAGEASRSKMLLKLENTIKQVPGGTGVLEGKFFQSLKQLKDFTDATIRGAFAQPNIGPAAAATRVATAYDRSLRDLHALRQSNADRLFSEVDELGKGVQVPMANFMRAVDDEVAENNRFFTFEDKSELAAWLSKKKEEIIEAQGLTDLGERAGEAVRLTIPQFKNLLSEVGEGASGIRLIGERMGASASKKTSSKLFGALMDDLDDLAASSPKEVGSALKGARQQYRADSEVLDAAVDDTMEQIFNSIVKKSSRKGTEHLTAADLVNPEVLLDRIVNGSFKKNDLAKMTAMIEKIDPIAAADMRGTVLEEIAGKASVSKDLEALGFEYSPASLGSALKKRRDTLEGLLTPAQIANVDRIINVSTLKAQTAGMAGSQTFPGGMWLKAASVLGGNVFDVIPVLKNYLSVRGIAKVLADPDAANHFFHIADPPKWASKRTMARAAAQLQLFEEMTNEDLRREPQQ